MGRRAVDVPRRRPLIPPAVIARSGVGAGAVIGLSALAQASPRLPLAGWFDPAAPVSVPRVVLAGLVLLLAFVAGVGALWTADRRRGWIGLGVVAVLAAPVGLLAPLGPRPLVALGAALVLGSTLVLAAVHRVLVMGRDADQQAEVIAARLREPFADPLGRSRAPGWPQDQS